MSRKGLELNNGAHYCRTMSPEFEQELMASYSWLIDLVRCNDSLDFQTGSNRGVSWFSVYRGTTRIVKLVKSGVTPISIEVANSYLELCPSIVDTQAFCRDLFIKYLAAIDNNIARYGRYYITENGERREGYYQNLISRRYTLDLRPDDDFLIIDKEMVLGFDNEEIKKIWNEEILQRQQNLLEQTYHSMEGTRLPDRNRVPIEYGEYDFLAVDKRGNFIIMELKQNDPTKTYFSPLQVNYYVLQLEKFLRDNREAFCNTIRTMLLQKQRMGLIRLPQEWILPESMAANVRSCVIVGDHTGISTEISRRFNVFRSSILPSLETFDTEPDGTIKHCSF